MEYLILIFGLLIGSFLNVVILRLKTRESILFTRSHCPHCGKVLKWHQLIPLVSFLIQKGKCTYCKKKISWQYPLVELLTASLFLLIFNFKLPFLITFYYFLIASFLIVISVYDLKYYLIPDEIIYPAIIIVLLFNLTLHHYTILLSKTFWILMLLSLSGAGFFFLIVLISKGKWMGLGDVKLAVFMGLLLGWPSILLALFLSFIIGGFVGLILILFGRKTLKSEIPFGPFLCLGTLITLLYGSQILSWYLFLM